MAGTARKVSCSITYSYFEVIFLCYFISKHSCRSYEKEVGLLVEFKQLLARLKG